MGFRINNNISALVAQGNLRKSQGGISKSIERLSSGLRINRGADDAAGLTISEKLRGQIRGLNRASANAQDGISLIQTAEGALNEDASILNRLRELAIQSQDDALTANDRLEIQKEVDQLVDEVDRISRTTEFNTKKLLDGSASALVSSDSSDLDGYQTGDIAAGDYAVSVRLQSNGTRETQKSAIQTDKDSGNIAGLTTNLSDLTAFYDSDGNNILENPKTLTLRSNGNKAEITISGDLTLEEFATAVEGGITGSVSDGGLGLRGSTFAYDSTAGQFVFESGIAGASGELSLASEENVIQALSMQVTTEATSSAYKVTATQEGVASPTTISANTTTDTASGVIDGLALNFTLASEARVDGSKATTKALNVGANNIVFTFHDTNAGYSGQGAGVMSAGVTVQLTKNRTYTLSSIENIVNSAIQGANNVLDPLTQLGVTAGGPAPSGLFSNPGVTASMDGYNLVLTSSIKGSSGSISISGNTAASDILGIQSGKVTGSSGTAAVMTGSVDISGGITFSGTNELKISVGDADYHQGDQTTATNRSILFNTGVAISGTSIVSSFNSYFSANSVNVEASMNSEGKLELRSTETGGDAKISITENAGSLSDLGFISGQTAAGAGGNAAVYTGTSNSSIQTTAYTLEGVVRFKVADKNGAQTDWITVGTENIDFATTESFAISKDALASLVDGSTLNSTDVEYSFDAGNRLDFASRSAGSGSRIVLNTFAGGNDATWARNAFGIDFNSAAQGSGDTDFTLHVTDGKLNFQIGANRSQRMDFGIANVGATALGLNGLDITNTNAATRALANIDTAVNKVSSERSKLGSLQNRMTSTINNLTVTSTNLQSTESQIRDVDIAKETVEFTRNQILIQAGTAQLAQSKGLGQNALQLLA